MTNDIYSIMMRRLLE